MSDDKPLGHVNYEQFAARYAAAIPTKAHNALYERPATLSLLPPSVRDLYVLDAGCGPGIYSEWLARRGARVQAFDVTPEMLAIASERLAGLEVEVRQADLTKPLDWLPDGRFDLVLCPLVLDYVADWTPVFAELRRVTRPGGLLIFSVGHPITDWEVAGCRDYYDTTVYEMTWKGFGEPYPRIRSYRRPFAAMVNPLLDAGWLLDRIVEPRPSEELRAAAPKSYEELARIRAFLCIRARKRSAE